MKQLSVPTVVGDKLGVIIGSSPILGYRDIGQQVSVDTAWGPVDVVDAGAVIVLWRHGRATFTPAHLVDHKRNIAALCGYGCDRVLATASVGSLGSHSVGSLVVPDDLIAFAATDSYFIDGRGHAVRAFDAQWRKQVLKIWRSTGAAELHDGGIYAQTRGPRFETPAEVGVLAQQADIVGMTIASECFLAAEAGLAYAAVGVVDNLANGLGATALSITELDEVRTKNGELLRADLDRVLPALATTPRF